MQKLMRAKFAGICSRTGARINKGDEIIFDTTTRTAYITNEDDTPHIQTDYVSDVFNFSGREFYRNKKGRCEDAPCCGCCTI